MAEATSEAPRYKGRPYVPPGVAHIASHDYSSPHDQDEPHDAAHSTSFEDAVDKTFRVPSRLADKPYELIEAANDWHFAMMNDTPRNHFYRDALKRVITPESVVLEIGAGSGLLSIIAASLGARVVVAVEANEHLAGVARRIIRSNGYAERIHVLNKMSTDVTPDDLERFGTPTILLSEILGTLMLGESALHYVSDARDRLCAPHTHIVPARGCQFATLVQSDDIRSITSVKSWDGINLDYFNMLQDTTSLVFTKQYGFRFSSCAYQSLCERLPVFSVDFARDAVGKWDGDHSAWLQVKRSGTVHAVLASWEVRADGGDDDHRDLRMATHPEETLENFPRDMQWGQGLQLIEDHDAAGVDGPVPFAVSEGEWLQLISRFSSDGVTMNFELRRAGAPGLHPEPAEQAAPAAPANHHIRFDP